ncbi:MGMT family protein [Streptomyces europaeiscabiei]|uniref:MGMT family protein n=2 Tax=Streptomyces europaeiscabiei TaxID=146819 RepID=A0ABU4NBB4_9ACTN|nr:MGMT family protein [Streptomyces europaeiscabiei]MDX2762247.1 MGMT family protein [Streptomyces europaeiscabiei]MDX2772030.1 MGMT family protein [Streptomyces europaeiscabiei]MDX3543357.1 MGMT family protein [Streptomyces europaeiscabiei]MDX3553173.1 MGMT family protein [Streptomyces europaeiscabiei]
MVACPVGTQGHQGAMRGRTVCPKTAPGARDARVGHHVPLSVGWGRMGRMSEESLPVDALPEYAERVLEVTDLIPPGRVMTYGDVAEWLGEGGPRQVGRVMALYGGAVAWWRVVRADGVLLPGHELRALDHYRREGTPLREASRTTEGHVPRVDMRRARWDGGERAEGHT